MVTTPPPLALILRRHRLAAGMTTRQLAKAVGVGRQAAYSWEQGDPVRPNRDNLDRIAIVHGLSDDDYAELVAVWEAMGARRLVTRRKMSGPHPAPRLTNLAPELTELCGVWKALHKDGEHAAANRIVAIADEMLRKIEAAHHIRRVADMTRGDDDATSAA